VRGGGNFQTRNVFVVNTPGNYPLLRYGLNGCISVATVVSIVDPLILTPVVTKPAFRLKVTDKYP
jgi:hypothetical protein